MTPRHFNTAWQLFCRPSAKRFDLAIENPRQAQQKILLDTLRQNRTTRFGQRYRFGQIDSIRSYQERVPLQTYDSLAEMILATARGDDAVLTRQKATRLLPSSGSSAARKLLPFTRGFQTQLNHAISPWIHDLFVKRPALKNGRAFWSVSPKFDETRHEDYALPVGFESDSAYLNRWTRPLAEKMFAVPSGLNAIPDFENFRYQQLLYLLACEDLSLISVWHPSYLTLLLNQLPDRWSAILADLGRQKHSKDRVEFLKKTGHESIEKLWPGLKLISCWGSAHAAGALRELRTLFPTTEFQEKGLFATEAAVSIPVIDDDSEGTRKVLAINSHFLEFLHDDGATLLADELAEGESYRVIVTTGAGLYRYQLQDRIVVTGRLKQTPTIEFVGKEDSISDYYGEKLADSFVAQKLDDLLGQQGIRSVFTMLAPDGEGDSLGYTLYIEATGNLTAQLAGKLDDTLSENPHYRLCRQLGQLAPVRVFKVSASSNKTFISRQLEQGRNLGDIKPVTLSSQMGWSQRFTGRYLPAGANLIDA